MTDSATESRGRSLADVEHGLGMPLQDAMSTQRAIRRLLPDPVDDAIVLRCIELALKAPTGSNGQNWEFVIVKDREVKERLAKRNFLVGRAGVGFLHDGRMSRLPGLCQFTLVIPQFSVNQKVLPRPT